MKKITVLNSKYLFSPKIQCFNNEITNTPFLKIRDQLPISRKFKIKYIEDFKFRFIRQLNELTYVIKQENRFEKIIKYENFQSDLTPNFSYFVENFKDLYFFIDPTQFLNYFAIIQKTHCLEINIMKKLMFFQIFLDYFCFFLDNEKSKNVEIFKFLEIYLAMINLNNFSNKNTNSKIQEILNKILLYYQNIKPNKKYNIQELMIFLDFIKTITWSQSQVKKIFEVFYVDIFKEEYIEIIESKDKYNYILWKLEYLSLLDLFPEAYFNSNEIQMLLNLELDSFFLENLKKMCKFQSKNIRFSQFLVKILSEGLEKMEKMHSTMLNKLNILEQQQLILVLAPTMRRNFNLKKKIMMAFLNSFEERTNDFCMEPKDIQIYSSRKLYSIRENENFEKELQGLFVLNLFKIDLKALMICFFLDQINIIDLNKYKFYLFTCIKNRIKDEKSLILSHFFKFFQNSMQNVPQNRVPIYLEVFEEIILENLDNIIDKNTQIKHLSSTIPWNQLVFYENYKLTSKFDNFLMEYLFEIEGLNLPQSDFVSESLKNIYSLKLFNFYRELFVRVKINFKTMDFITQTHYLSIISRIYSFGDYLNLTRIFLLAINPQNIKFSSALNYYKLFDLLIYHRLIEKLDENALKYLFDSFLRFITKYDENQMNLTMKKNLKKIEQLFQVSKLLNKDFFIKYIPNEINLRLKSINQIEKKINLFKKSKFQRNFVKILKFLYPKIKIKENFYLFAEEFECDVWIEDFEILIELCGPTHFLSNTMFEMNIKFFEILKIKENILKPRKIVVIPYFEYFNLSDGSSNEKLNYIKRKIMS